MLLQPECLGDRPLGWYITTAVAQDGVVCFCECLRLMGGAQIHPHQALRDRRPILAAEQNITGSVDRQPDDLAPVRSTCLQTTPYCYNKRVPPVPRVLLCPTRLRVGGHIILIVEAEGLPL